MRVSESAFAWSNDETWSYHNFRNGEPNNSGNLGEETRADLDDGTGTGTPDGGVSIVDLLY